MGVDPDDRHDCVRDRKPLQRQLRAEERDGANDQKRCGLRGPDAEPVAGTSEREGRHKQRDRPIEIRRHEPERSREDRTDEERVDPGDRSEGHTVRHDFPKPLAIDPRHVRRCKRKRIEHGKRPMLDDPAPGRQMPEKIVAADRTDRGAGDDQQKRDRRDASRH